MSDAHPVGIGGVEAERGRVGVVKAVFTMWSAAIALGLAYMFVIIATGR